MAGWEVSDACRDEWCEECYEDTCSHHCHDNVYFDYPTITWRRMETVAVTATNERGEPVL